MSLPAYTEEYSGFSDVDGSTAYGEAILWAAEQESINGYPDGHFGVNDAVTRAQLASIFYRTTGSPAALERPVSLMFCPQPTM